MLTRAYSVLQIKAIDEDLRIIEGIATTPATDRMDDVVEPMGGEFTLPIPFLWQHESWEAAVGEVFEAKPSPNGIAVKIRVEKDDVPGILKDRLDYAWRSIVKKLVRGLSIGFTSLESSNIDGTWGQRYIRWDWLELSAVTIPANAEASIQTIKSYDTHAASSGSSRGVDRPASAGPVKIKSMKSGASTMNLSEQISGLEATRQAKHARKLEIQKTASESGATKDAAQREEFDTLTDEIKSVDLELKDLRELETETKAVAVPVNGATLDDAAAARGGQRQVVRSAPRLPPGVAFARVARCIGIAHRNNRDVEAVARQLYPDDHLLQKAAVAAGTTAHATWAGPLVGDESSVFADFVEFLRPQTIIGKFGAGGVPSLRLVPFRTPLVGQTSGGDAYWTGEGKGKGLTKFDFARTTLEPLKLANIAVLTEELLKSSSPSADTIIRDQLAAALRARMDTDFVDPAKVAVSGVSPASITNAVAAIPSAGATMDDVDTDIKAIFGAFLAANNTPTTGVWIMPATVALALSLMKNPLGQPSFPGIGMNGGTFAGLPVIVSEYVPTSSAGAYVILANAGDIYLGDDGDIALDVSREASLQMDSEPTIHSDGTPAAAQLVSLWQTNSVGFRAERTINWAKRRTEAVQVLSGVTWGAGA